MRSLENANSLRHLIIKSLFFLQTKMAAGPVS